MPGSPEVVGALRTHHDPLPSRDDQFAAGRDARGALPRRAHGDYAPDPHRDPVGILQQQNRHRLGDLIPLRIERMLQNPFTFYRGTAAIQAADLAAGPVTGANISVCGDAHLVNFGLYASPQRTMTFDLNDFDEAAFGPWEWDVKRFVTSVVVAARHKGMRESKVQTAALEAAASYRLGLRQLVQLDVVQRYYARADPSRQSSTRHTTTQHVLDRALRAAERRTSQRVVAKITQTADDGSVTIRENPPTLTHVPEKVEKLLVGIVQRYLATVPPDVAVLLSQYTPTDAARRVVGVGSVGTRCYIVVLTGPSGESLVLQVKEATSSVLEELGGMADPLPPALARLGAPSDHGFRVVAGQRILQAVSDPFLGHLEIDGHYYYVRQFRDKNISFDVDALDSRAFTDYVDACGVALARAHAQSPDSAFIAGYLGENTPFDSAVATWATAYADQSAADFRAVRKAAKDRAFALTE